MLAGIDSLSDAELLSVLVTTGAGYRLQPRSRPCCSTTTAGWVAWLGHVNLATTNRYVDINLRTKEAALRQCAPPPDVGGPKGRAPAWRNDETVLAWLASL